MFHFASKASRAIIKEADKRYDEPGGTPPEDKTFFQKLKTFCLHPTVWRLILLAAAVATTIITAGAIIPVITLAATALTAMISVVGKTIQHRSLERAKLQNSLTKVIAKREEDVQKLRKANHRIFDVLAKDGRPFAKAREIHEVKNVKPEHRGWSIARVLGYVGLEQFWTVSLLSTAANPVGAVVYGAGLALGTLVIKSEYDYRVKEEQERSRLKEETNQRCKMLGIAKFSNDKELYGQFRSRMINYKAAELLCKEDTSKLSDTVILQRFEVIRKDVESKITFTNIPQQVSFTRNVANALNPFKDENAVRRFDIKFDEERCHYEMSKGYEVIKDQGVKGQSASKDHVVIGIGDDDRLEAAAKGLKEVKVDEAKAVREEGDMVKASQRLQEAQAEGERSASGPATIDEAQEGVRDAVKKGFVDEEKRRDNQELSSSREKQRLK